MNQLVTIETDNALEVYTTEKGLEPYLEKIKKEIDAFVPDISTKTSRKNIASMAMKVSKSKAYLDGVGKDLVTELKKKPKLIDAERKRMRDTLDQWKDQVRHPLTEWEAAEKERIDRIQNKINAWKVSYKSLGSMDSNAIRLELVSLESENIDDSFDEFREYAESVKLDALGALNKEYNTKKIQEQQAIELARLKAVEEKRIAEEEERIRIQMEMEHEERIRREAEELAKLEAQGREAALKEQAELAEKQAREAGERIERERIENEKRIKEAELRATREAEEAEARRVANETAEALRREKNVAHKRAINKAALTALCNAGIDEVEAKKAIKAIASNLIPGITIKY